MLSRPRTNSFLAMAMLADRESWCWNLSCTTCGCHIFRHGLHELAKGVHPESAQWELHFHEGQFPERFNRAPQFLSKTDQVVISAIVSQLDIRDLIRNCNSPDWLGYLGLVLHQTTDAEAETGLLTRTLLPQLLAAVRNPTERRTLKNRFSDGRKLCWQDLEEFEHHLSGFRRV